MRSSKSRSRSKNNRNRPSGNVVNRVFDSSGPEGKVRGTPQQIIDKYQSLARDAQLSNDRVAAENFLQHAEHYTRMLGEAQREQEERRLQQEREHQVRMQREQQEREAREARRAEQEQRRQERQQPEEAQEAEPVAVEADPRPATDAVPADAGPADLARAAEAMNGGMEGGPIDVPEERKRPRRRRKPAAQAESSEGQSPADPPQGEATSSPEAAE